MRGAFPRKKTKKQMPQESHLPVYRFDQADAQLSLLPMAARRALDCAGLHLSLKGWQALSLEQRQALVLLGGTDPVDGARVAELLAERSADMRPTPPLTEADAAAGPSAELLQALPAGRDLSHERWRALSALDRYVLVQLARRGKLERLAEAYLEICD
jgi:hypothetical protein